MEEALTLAGQRGDLYEECLSLEALGGPCARSDSDR